MKGDRLFLFYEGKSQGLFDDLHVSEGRWLASLLVRLSDRQLADAFRAANYTPAEVQTLTSAVRARVNELAEATGVATGRSPAAARR